MLRFLVFIMLIAGVSMADELKVAKNNAIKAIDDAKKFQLSDEFKSLLEDERNNLSSVEWQSKPLISIPNKAIPLGSEFQKILKVASSIDQKNSLTDVPQAPIVLVSFSMPEIELKKLIYEAKRINASIAIRGLYRNSFQETYKKIASLFDAGDDAGILIDPTLFRRFEVKFVPTFILPLEKIARCTSNGCPVEKHIRASGSVSIDYFLDYITRVKDGEHARIANFWLRRLRSLS